MRKPGHVLALLSGLALSMAVSSGLEAQGNYRGNSRRSPDRLSGTYQLDRNQSDNTQQAVMRATRSLPADRRDRVYQNWVTRLDSPQSLAIDVQGRSVTIASSNGPQTTFDADGQDRTEVGPNGNQIITHADVRNSVLSVATTGSRGTDFAVTFAPVAGGLRVTRTLESGYDGTQLVVRSVYRRVEDQPRWNVDQEGPVMLVPETTELVARLERGVSSRTSQDGERVTATVVEGQYRGAVLDGSVVHAAPQDGKIEMSFNFDRIHLRDGRSANFAGQLMAVTTPNGANIQVDREGDAQAQLRNNGDRQLQNGAIGAALGAIVGAIAGGGKGAGIGAVVGGGTGVLSAGSGHSEELEMPAGTQLTIAVVSLRRTMPNY